MTAKSVTLWLVVFGLSLAAAKAPVQPAGYEYYGGAEGSLKLHSAAPWRDARGICLGEGAELASPETPGLLTAMSTLLLSSAESPEQVFTGINDLYAKGFFSSLRGTPLSDMRVRWAAGALANLTTRNNCLALRRDGLLRDTTCDKALPYFCFRREKVGPIITECGLNSGYTFNNDTKSCYTLHTSRPWGEAYATCQREGADLLVLSSSEEALFIRNLTRTEGTTNIHVGATRWKDGLWMTVHGETLGQAGFDKWNDNNGTDSCASLHCADAVLNQQDCSQALPFICEKNAYLDIEN